MQSGLNLLSLFLMLSNTKRVKIILLLMLCRAVMLCYLNLTSKYLDWKLLRNNMCMMLNLKMCCRIVEMVELGTSSSSMMDLCFVLTNYAFQIALFVFCCYRRRMEEDCWDTLVSRRRRMFLLHTSFGHVCVEMLSDLWHAALLVKKLSLALIHMVYICLFLFLGRIFLWTLFWDCHEHRRGGIVFLLLWIGFIRWHTLFLVIKRMMLHILLICSFVKLFVCMVCQILLSLIVILNFLATFGDVYGLSWGLNCSLVLHVIPKLMVKLK